MRLLLSVSLLSDLVTIPDWPTLDALERAGAVRAWPFARPEAYRAAKVAPSHEDYRLLCTLIRQDSPARYETTFSTPDAPAPAKSQPVAQGGTHLQRSLSHV